MTGEKPLRVLVLAGPPRDRDRKFWLARYAPAGLDVTVSTIPIRRFHSFPHRILAALRHNLAVLPGINRYDAVLSMGSLAGALIALLQRLFPALVRPVHVTIDIALPRMLSDRSTCMLACARFIFASLRMVICHSTRQRRFWETALGAEGRAEFVPIGIDPAAVAGPDTGGNGGYLFCAGRAGRDYATLSGALEGLQAECTVVTGRDPVPVSDMRSPLSRLAALPNVTVRDEIPYDEYVRLLTNAAAVVLPLEESEAVSGQVVLLEAMAAGRTVIASDVNGTTDYVRDGETGYLVPPGNTAALRDRIRHVLASPRPEIGTAARDAVLAGFTEQAMARRVAGILKRAAAPEDAAA